jgi:hypothetical protein
MYLEKRRYNYILKMPHREYITLEATKTSEQLIATYPYSVISSSILNSFSHGIVCKRPITVAARSKA